VIAILRVFVILGVLSSVLPANVFAAEAISNSDVRHGTVSVGASENPPASLSMLPRVFVKQIVLTGNTVLSVAEISGLTAPYTGREVSFEELQTLRQELTLSYVNKGYLTSGAIIPDQEVRDGIITIQAIEGSVARIAVEGTKHFRPLYISDRLSLATGPPVNAYTLQEALQHLQQDQRIKKLNAELQPGISKGESVLNVKVEEDTPYVAVLKFNNRQSPSVGAYRGELRLAHQNVLGFGDVLDGTFGLTEGANDYGFSYSIPLTSRDTMLELHYRKSAYTVIEEVFKNLDIKSRSETYGFGLSRPLYRTRSSELRLALTFEIRENETFLLGQPYSFSEGTEEGKSRVSVLRFSQEWADRSQNSVIALRSSFSMGVDAFGATVNSTGTDGRFFTWTGQTQWIRRLTDDGMQMICRGDLQLSRDPLLPLEKFSVGGMSSVRGYRENRLVRDNGLAASVELRIPVFPLETGENTFYVAPFVDFGRSWNSGNATSDRENIYSTGIGALWDITKRISLQIYWGYALRQMENSENTLQDRGIHFQLTGRLF
jgi:hemolysin activation/secretion protein